MSVTFQKLLPEYTTMKCDDHEAHNNATIDESANVFIHVTSLADPNKTEMVVAQLAFTTCDQYPGTCVRAMLSNHPIGSRFVRLATPSECTSEDARYKILQYQYNNIRSAQSKLVPQDPASVYEMAKKTFDKMAIDHATAEIMEKDRSDYVRFFHFG